MSTQQANNAPLQMSNDIQIGEHAVVIGASMGGLLAARVLADAFGRVTIIERDSLSDTAASRRGVPQGRHAHGLLTAGAHVLAELFPGLLDEFVASGVTVVHEPSELYFAPGGHKFCQHGQFSEPSPSYQPSRPYLEWRIRTRLREMPNVEVIDRCKVVDLASAADRVTGVVVQRAGEAEQALQADLVLDATGRAGRAAGWLESMGYEKPSEDRLEVDIRYVSRRLRLRAGAMGREKVVIVGAEPGRPTGVNFLKQEDDCWILTLIGYGGFHPPTDPEGFLKFAEAVVPAHAFAAIRDAEALDDPVAHRYPANVRRRYDRLTRFPTGFLVFGDALCSFNPIYGQGMSTAALQATALRDCLRGGSEQLARRFFKAAVRRTEVAWQLAVGGDLALPEVKGPRPLPARIANAYISRVLLAAEHDWAIAERFLKVGWLIAPPTLLLTPSTVARVLLGNRHRRRAGVGAPGGRQLDPTHQLMETR
jgi:2-polyprenyl-6-methoxyphenol hydroxylase-like FAD-dependent oxidoreductase